MKYILIVLVILALLAWASSQRTRRRKGKKMPHPASGRDLAHVQTAIAAGEKIRAVKIYRDATDTDLRTAKYAVDRIARGEDPALQ